MACLLDTGILLRLIDADDPLHLITRQAVDILIGRGEELWITTQNIAELWNVATRPVANNGLALPTNEVAKLYDETIAPACGVLIDADSHPDVFTRLLKQYTIVGKQVHDARLVASMLTWQIDRILTLNERNFRRYEPGGITVITPSSIVKPS